jgi:hypothetical protein
MSTWSSHEYFEKAFRPTHSYAHIKIHTMHNLSSNAQTSNMRKYGRKWRHARCDEHLDSRRSRPASANNQCDHALHCESAPCADTARDALFGAHRRPTMQNMSALIIQITGRRNHRAKLKHEQKRQNMHWCDVDKHGTRGRHTRPQTRVEARFTRPIRSRIATPFASRTTSLISMSASHSNSRRTQSVRPFSAANINAVSRDCVRWMYCGHLHRIGSTNDTSCMSMQGKKPTVLITIFIRLRTSLWKLTGTPASISSTKSIARPISAAFKNCTPQDAQRNTRY